MELTPKEEQLFSRIDSDNTRIQVLSEKLDELLLLEPDWNSYGAERVKPQVITASKHLLHLLFGIVQGGPIYIVPTTSGGIQLEFFHNQYEIELEINNEHDITLLHTDLTTGRAHTFDITLGEVSEHKVEYVEYKDNERELGDHL